MIIKIKDKIYTTYKNYDALNQIKEYELKIGDTTLFTFGLTPKKREDKRLDLLEITRKRDELGKNYTSVISNAQRYYNIIDKDNFYITPQGQIELNSLKKRIECTISNLEQLVEQIKLRKKSNNPIFKRGEGNIDETMILLNKVNKIIKTYTNNNVCDSFSNSKILPLKCKQSDEKYKNILNMIKEVSKEKILDGMVNKIKKIEENPRSIVKNYEEEWDSKDPLERTFNRIKNNMPIDSIDVLYLCGFVNKCLEKEEKALENNDLEKVLNILNPNLADQHLITSSIIKSQEERKKVRTITSDYDICYTLRNFISKLISNKSIYGASNLENFIVENCHLKFSFDGYAKEGNLSIIRWPFANLKDPKTNRVFELEKLKTIESF
jgi:hypothetical protein